MKHKIVEDKVLGVYREVNPSLRSIERSDASYEQQMRNRKSILQELCLPPALFRGKRVLEIGGGTGENSLYYAMHGADVTILEPNEISCKRAEHKTMEWNKRGLTYIDERLFQEDRAKQVEVRKGQVAFFDFNLIHKSGLQISDNVRYTVLARFGSAKSKITQQIKNG